MTISPLDEYFHVKRFCIFFFYYENILYIHILFSILLVDWFIWYHSLNLKEVLLFLFFCLNRPGWALKQMKMFLFLCLLLFLTFIESMIRDYLKLELIHNNHSSGGLWAACRFNTEQNREEHERSNQIEFSYLFSVWLDPFFFLFQQSNLFHKLFQFIASHKFCKLMSNLEAFFIVLPLI